MRQLSATFWKYLRRADYESLLEKCPYSELFWSVFSGIQTEYGEIQSVKILLLKFLKELLW